MTIREDIETYFGDAITALEENLQAMGVTDAEFDPETGLIGLANEIQNIPVNKEIMILRVTGNSFTSYYPIAFDSDGYIEWGDGTSSNVSGYVQLSHSYTDGLSSHTIKCSNVTSLGDSCFRDCTGLTSINIPNNVTSIERDCFFCCTGLTSINIPNNVTSLVEYCFYKCTSLTSINIPFSVTSIGRDCFSGCFSLTEVILNWDTSNSIVSYNSSNFHHTNEDLVFSIPNGTTQIYIDADYPSEKLVERSA